MSNGKILDPFMQIKNTPMTVGSFWAWAYSDILSNRNRSIYAEFLVCAALNQIGQCRIEWDAVDICYQGLKIEVKSAAYLQSWKQSKPSLIRFDISKKKSWYAETNTYSKEACRPSDLYIFCLFSEQDANKADVLDTSQWTFFIVETKMINEVTDAAKSISLQQVKTLGQAALYDQIKSKIDCFLSSK